MPASAVRACIRTRRSSIELSHQYPAASQQTILAVDFGGGTLDLCLLKRFEEGFKVIGTHGLDWAATILTS